MRARNPDDACAPDDAARSPRLESPFGPRGNVGRVALCVRRRGPIGRNPRRRCRRCRSTTGCVEAVGWRAGDVRRLSVTARRELGAVRQLRFRSPGRGVLRRGRREHSGSGQCSLRRLHTGSMRHRAGVLDERFSSRLRGRAAHLRRRLDVLMRARGRVVVLWARARTMRVRSCWLACRPRRGLLPVEPDLAPTCSSPSRRLMGDP